MHGPATEALRAFLAVPEPEAVDAGIVGGDGAYAHGVGGLPAWVEVGCGRPLSRPAPVFLPLMAHGETTHHYGMNLGILLRHRIGLMERFGDLEPAIDFDYMLRTPPGSTITEKAYKGF